MEQSVVPVGLAIAGWYATSFGTLLLNKYLLGERQVPPNTLAMVQMFSTAIYGAIKTLTVRDLQQLYQRLRQVAAPKGKGGIEDVEDGRVDSTGESKGYFDKEGGDRWRRGMIQMAIVGAMRFATVVLGLVSLKHVAASFTETVKASAPFFTVIIAYLMLGEKSTMKVVCSLVPVAAGLVMVSSSELSFNYIGFFAAISTNIIECVQNVFSKRLLAREYTASQLQFYTSLTALVLQAPLFFMNSAGPAAVVSATTAAPSLVAPALSNALVQQVALVDSGGRPLSLFDNGTLTELAAGVVDLASTIRPEGALLAAGPLVDEIFVVYDPRLFFLLWVDGVLYHMQSVVAYVVMSYLSPVTVSVVNTLKRALLIWISVLVFGNTISGLAKVGTAVCFLGVLWYNIARQQRPPDDPPKTPTSGRPR